MKKQMLLKDLTVGMEFEALGHKFVLLDTIFYDKQEAINNDQKEDKCSFNNFFNNIFSNNKFKQTRNKLFR